MATVSSDDESNAVTVSIVYIVFTVVFDGLIHLALQIIATKGPGKSLIQFQDVLQSDIEQVNIQQSQSDNDNENVNVNSNNDQAFHIKLYKYLFKPKYPIITNEDIQNSNLTDSDKNEDVNYFKDNTIMRIFTECTCYKYLKFSLQFWAFCCGFLALYLSLVFWGNLFAEYTFAAIGRSDESPGSIFGLVAVYFLVEIIFWFLKRQIESIILLTRNVGDLFDIKLILFWRIYDVILIIICVGCIRINSSVWFFQWLMLLMVIRGLIWQAWHAVIVLIGTFTIIIYKLCIIDNSSNSSATKWINWKELIFVMDNRPELMTQCTWYKYIYTVIIWILIIAFFGCIPIYMELFIFAACIMIIYYLIILIDIGKYDVWYSLWSGKYHSQYFGYKSNDNNDYYMQQDTELMVIGSNKDKYQPVSGIDDNKDEEEDQEQKDDNIEQSNQDIIVPDAETMIFMDYWERVKYRHNHYMCSCCWCYCPDQCPPSKQHIIDGCKAFCVGLIKWVCIVILILCIFLTVYYWLQPEPAAENPPTFTTNAVNRYEVCNRLWAGDYITIVDLIFLVKSSSYIKWDDPNDPNYLSKQDLFVQFDLWFGKEAESGWNYSSLVYNSQPGFYSIRNEKQQIQLLINRPTNTNMDIIQNIRLFGEATLFHVFSFAIPLSSLLPIAFIREFIEFASIPETVLSPTIHDNYDNVVYDYIVELSKKSNTNNMKYLVQGGHRLSIIIRYSLK